MAKTQTIKFSDFMDGSYKKKGVKEDLKIVGKVISATAPALILIVPKSILAATADATFGNIHKSIMHIFDSGVVLVIIFAGAAWGLGHRTKAIEILIGVCCGYVLARHATDIRDFLQGI